MFSPGQTLGNYQLQDLLGRGGMGAVYRALDMNLQRTVALKVMQPEVAQHEELRQRFIQEARAAAALNHPNVVRVFEFYADSSPLYLVMELVQGGSLRDYLGKMATENYVMHPDEAIYIIQQACSGLYHAHSQGMIHRDVKPDNVLLKANPVPGGMPYTIVLTDFGLAKLVDAQNLVKTQLNRPLGTLPYMAPEQFLGTADARSDLYALGIMFYELLAGQLPFLPRNMVDAASMHTKQQPVPISQIRSDLPPHIEAVLTKALAKSPNDRFQTAAEFGLALAPNSPDARYSTPKPPVAPVAVPVVPVAAPGPTPQIRVAAHENFAEDTIVVVNKDGQIHRRIPIRTQMLTIGRDPNLEIPLAGEKVSRRHAQITRRPDGTYSVVDLGSSNGSFLAGARLVKDVTESWPPEQDLIVGEFALQLYKASAQPKASNKTQLGVAGQAAGKGQVGGGGHVGGTQIFDVSAAYSGGQSAGQSSNQQPYGAYPQGYNAQPQDYGGQPQGYGGQAAVPVAPLGQGNNIIRVMVEPGQVMVDAGSIATANVSIYNTSKIVKHCRLRITGLDQEWYQIPASSLQLLPDEGGELSIILKPPRHATSTAGQHIFDIRVIDEKSEMIGWGQGILVVRPYYEFEIGLEPEIIRKRGLVLLTIHNQGNARDSYLIRGRDKEDGLRFYHDTAPIIIDPLTKVALEIEVRPKGRVLIGGSKMYQYELETTTASQLEKSANGQLISPAVFPVWILPLFMLLCLCLLLLLLFLYFNRDDDKVETPEPTPTFTITPTVNVAPLTDLLTATANAFQSTIIPNATATVDALLGSDFDNDDLTYEDELARGTEPDLPDSDGDGLTDGEEVNNPEFPSDPTLSDTDDDGLTDFEELEEDTDPDNEDSDDDGLTDFEEVRLHDTDPNERDTDTDGIRDDVEVELGSDPNDFNSRPAVPPQ